MNLSIFENNNDVSKHLRPVNGKRFALVDCRHDGLDLLELWDKDVMEFGSIMNNSTYEKERNLEIVTKARGDVFIAGFGMGLIVLPIINKPEVTSVEIAENQQEIIDLIASQLPLNEKVKIIKCNYFEFKPSHKYDTIYLDTVEEDKCTEKEKESRIINGKFHLDQDMIEIFAQNLKPGGFLNVY